MILTETAVGLELERDVVRVVALRKRFDRIRLAGFGEEELESTQPDAIAATIRGLFDRLHLTAKEVVIALNGQAVRHFVMEAPALAANELSEYVRRSCCERLPIKLDPSQLAVSFHPYAASKDRSQLLVAFCHLASLQEKLAVIEAAGLAPVMVGAGEIDASLAFAFEDERFLEKSLLFVILKENGHSLVVTQRGAPAFYLDNGVASDHQKPDLVQDILSELSQRPQNGSVPKFEEIILIDRRSTPESSNLNGALSQHDLKPGLPMRGLLANGKELPPRYSLAAGLALKRFFPALNRIDLLPDDKRSTWQEAREKRNALRVILAGGVFVLLCWLGLNLTHVVFADKLEETNEQVLLFQQEIAGFKELERTQNNLEGSLRDLESLVTRRSRYARLLEEIGRVMPEGVWLNELNSESGSDAPESNSYQFTLTGWALDEARLAACLERLEQSSHLTKLELAATSKLPGEEVWRRSQVKAVSLVEFRVRGRFK